MPTFTVTVPPGEGTRVMNALCARAGLEPTQANALQALRDYVVQVVMLYEHQLAYAAVVEPIPVNPT